MSQIDLRPFLADPSALPKATTLLREAGIRALLLHLKAGDEIPEHQASGAITVQCLQGEVSFSVAGSKIPLSPGVLIGVPPGSPHSLAAGQESLLLVTMSEPAPANS